MRASPWGLTHGLVQVPVDEVLAPIVEKLKEDYPIGCCTLHPGIRCFYYTPMDWHFELDSPKLKVWSYGIIDEVDSSRRL